jgi:predicted hotdog family 3-hydroxylacyl-ACP dehydratase
MLLLSRVLEHAPERTVCAVEVNRSELFRDPDGGVPGWVGLEYMAQCVAAHGGLVARACGATFRPGLFLGSRRVRLHVDRFDAGQVLHVTVRHHRGDSGLLSFDCELRDAGGGAALAEGRLSFYTTAVGAAREESDHGR